MKKEINKKTIGRLANDFLGAECLHPYHPASDCPHMSQRERWCVKQFARWLQKNKHLIV